MFKINKPALVIIS